MIREDLTEIKLIYCNSWISEIYLEYVIQFWKGRAYE